MLPKNLRNFNLFIDGVGYAGLVDEITLPKLTRKTEELNTGGLAGPVEIDMGMEKLEMDFTVREYSDEIIKKYASPNISGIPMRLAGEFEHTGSGESQTVEISFKGRFRELDLGAVKRGELSTLKVAVALTYFKYISNGDELVEIDVINMIEKVAGVDRLEQSRRALGL